MLDLWWVVRGFNIGAGGKGMEWNRRTLILVSSLVKAD